MEKQKHTPEPWELASGQPGVTDQPSSVRQCYFIMGGDEAGHFDVAYTAPMGEAPEPLVREHANAARIVACVNACAGLNPEAIPDAIAALEEIAFAQLGHAEATHAECLAIATDTARRALARLRGEG